MDMTLQDLWADIETRYDQLPPRLREAARYVRDHPADVALHGLRRVARDAALSPAALARLVQTLGFGGWEEFQNLHRSWLTESGMNVFSSRAGSIGAQGAEATLLDRIAAAEMENIRLGLAPERRPRMADAARLLTAAPAIGVLGLRSCHSVAFALHYGLALFRDRVVLIGGAGGLVLDALDTLPPDAALVAISVAPYSRETVEATRHARDAGLRIVAMTDGELSPLSRLADITLIAGNDGPAHLASVTGFTALAQALTSLVLAYSGAEALAALRRREGLLAARSVYLPKDV